MSIRPITVDERRARLAVRQGLAPGAQADDPAAAARSVVVLHATDPASVVLSALARMRRPDPAAVEHALYEDRSLVRMLAMRRTLFTVSRDVLPIVHASSSLAVATAQRKQLVQLITDAGVGGRDPAAWLRTLEATTLAALRERGDATAAELTAAIPDLKRTIVLGLGTKWETTVGLTSRVLLLLAVDGAIVRGRTTGGWTSTMHRWVPVERWLGAPIEPMAVGDAQAELVRRWLERFGPGTEADLKWWTGWTLGQVRTALAALDVTVVEAETGDGRSVPAIVLADDVDPTPPPKPWVALLPSLDPTVMGWQERSWYLGPHKERLFDRNGNAGPTIWVDGRVVGGWTQRKDTGEVVTALLEPVPAAVAKRIARRAADLQASIGPARVTPRFPTPIDKDLRS
jgi:hypothetical protein